VARCPECQQQIRRGASKPLHLRIRGPETPWAEVPIAHLLQKLEGQGGALGSARAHDGTLRWSARAVLKTGTREQPIRWKDQLLGFFERFNPGKPGNLRLEGDLLAFDQDKAQTGEPLTHTWPIRIFQSLQSASSSIQFTTDPGELVYLAFENDSPRRWEILLREALQVAWTEEGRGEIAEVQPRIRVRN